MTPEGTKDFLFAECSAMDYICTSIEKVFVKGGFKRVITPALEFYDVFSIPSSGISQESMFKTTDNKGRLLVARPDSTLPIARMVSTRLKNNTLPVRLYYKQAVYRNNPSLAGRRNEFLQMGVELLGAKGKRADLEILTSAIKSISAVADDFRIELGHAEVFNALSKELDIDNDYKEKIRVSIESKNYSALNNLLDKLKQSVRSRHFSAVKKCLMRHMTSAKVQAPKTLLIISTQSIKNFPCLNSATSLSSTSDLFRETITIRESYFQGILTESVTLLFREEDMTIFSANLMLLWVRQALRLIQMQLQ